ncbi:hypothetical protein CONCODRAFT_79846 [Conidiobolus coronatus NRRL 28638]|uniref:Golgi apparatus membrane protein TVP18 n=1 Tax=Conidiobolus coronatus (strain ATCC 28846 / CBS 209.66 / NRRL 28638) TaxID=796925 RepID=A0A137NZG5_CONC2|nr:hypothetical protein CONCODRAFT_79846 [Conidiobolus coronatus NRRL 28638]|eukprot:KXN68216.1 hypothetical protein CONCODRAFT_79846 [Conidiobolus coronatus NRRL 28638]
MGFTDNLKEEIKSGKFTIYGQWVGLISGLILIIFGVVYIFSSLLVWAVISITAGVIVLFLEIPLFIKIFRTGERFEGFLNIFENNYFRASLYCGFAVANMLSCIQYVSSLIIGGVLLAISGICYALAGLKHQDRTTSKLTGGDGITGFATMV